MLRLFWLLLKKSSSFASPSTAEAFGIRWGLQLAFDLNHTNLILHLGALRVVHCVNGVSFVADLEPIIKDCQSLFRNFNYVSVLFVGRNHISDSHSLVRLGFSVGSRTWLGFVPRVEEIGVSLASLGFS